MVKYKVEFKKSAAKELTALPQKDIRMIVAKIKQLAENPRPHGCVKLSGDEKYRIRCGNYRILYSIFDDVLTIHVVKIGHRKDVYR